MARKKVKVSRLKNSTKNVIGEQGEQTTQLTKKHKASLWSNSVEETIGEQGEPIPDMSQKHRASWYDSVEEIIGELVGNASNPELPSALQGTNHEGSTSKKKRDPTESLKTDGLRYVDRVQVSENRRASWNDSVEGIIGELEGNASNLELPLALQGTNHEGSTSKKKRGPTKSLKTDGLRYEDRAQVGEKRGASCHDSVEEIIGELEGNASNPELPSALQETNHEGSTRKKKRGPTRSLKTAGIRYEDRVQVELNELGQPIGCHRATLSTYLGTLARDADFAPLIYTSWKGLKGSWDDMWQKVLQKFDLEERAKKWVLSTLSSCWRCHKCRLKRKYFKENMTSDYNFKNGPPSVPLEQWKLLVKFWKSNFAKERSKNNKNNRAKLATMHTTGSKTFAEIRHEEATNNPDGREPSRVEMYIMTHKPKDSNSMNEKTRRIMSELEDLMALHPEELEQSSTPDDLLSKVVGRDRHGCVRTYGKGVVASDLWGTRSVIETQKKIEEVKRNAEAEMQTMEEKMQEKMKEQVEAMKLEILGGFQKVLTEVQKCYPEAKIPDLSSILISDTNRGEPIDTPSSATADHAISKTGELIPENIGSKKGQKDKPHKKRRVNGS